MKARLRLAGTVFLLFALVAGGTFYWNPLWVNDQQLQRPPLARGGAQSVCQCSRRSHSLF